MLLVARELVAEMSGCISNHRWEIGWTEQVWRCGRWPTRWMCTLRPARLLRARASWRLAKRRAHARSRCHSTVMPAPRAVAMVPRSCALRVQGSAKGTLAVSVGSSAYGSNLRFEFRCEAMSYTPECTAPRGTNPGCGVLYRVADRNADPAR